MDRAKSTTEMEVTSIRLEKSLKQAIKDLSGSKGYQTMIRDILWNYVQIHSGDYRPTFSEHDIIAYSESIAQKDLCCVLSGKPINKGDTFLLCRTVFEDFVPVLKGTF